MEAEPGPNAPKPNLVRPVPPTSYRTPPGAVRVTTSAQLVQVLRRTRPTTIVLADGVYGDGLTPFQLTNRTGDLLYGRSSFQKEILDAPFEISPGIVIPPGDYSFDEHGFEIQFSGFRKVSGRIARTEGEFYDGTRSRSFGNFTWQPSPRFRTNVGFNINDIELPQGSFTTRIVSTGFDIVFSSTLSWVNLIQYDNVSETMGVNMRLHWIPEAGREVFFVINHNLEDLDRDDNFHSATADVVAKLNYTFRF